MKSAMLIVSCLLPIMMFFWGCGAEREVEPKVPVPPPSTNPKPPDNGDGDDKDTFADVQPIIQASCARCHASDGFIKSEAGWRASAAQTRTGNASMPPPGTPEARGLSPADRSRLVSF